MKPTSMFLGYIQKFTIAHNHYAQKPQAVPMVEEVCTKYINQKKGYEKRNATQIQLISPHHVDHSKPKAQQFWYWTVALLDMFGGHVTTAHVPQPTSKEWVENFKKALESHGGPTGGTSDEVKDQASKNVGEGENTV
ncbi:MAG: hypothetical protein LQ346_005016 [Caloplaca aetnensis]|nr:MAG: hypothetical protein LQ346_005016 [Caloplaca aetnensis]